MTPQPTPDPLPQEGELKPKTQEGEAPRLNPKEYEDWKEWHFQIYGHIDALSAWEGRQYEINELKDQIRSAHERERVLREALKKCFYYLGEEIKRKHLNESSRDGTQALSLEIARLLDGREAVAKLKGSHE